MSRTEKIIIIILVLAVIAAAIGIMTDSRRNQIIIEDFTEPSFESGALVGMPENVDESLRHSKMAVAEGFVVWMCADPVVTGGQARIFFTSEETNNVWVKVQFVDAEGTLIGESGLLRPGEYVENISLAQVPEEDGLITARILSYEQDTYYSKGTATAQVMLHLE